MTQAYASTPGLATACADADGAGGPATRERLRSRGDYRILSLAGGGYLGVFTACALAELEARAGEPVGRRFDLIAGTSVGGILAVALAFETPMAHVAELFLARGAAIFSKRAAASGRIGRLVDLSRAVFGPKYHAEPLREVLHDYLGDRRLRDALHSVVVPAVNITESRTKVFKTPHAAASMGDGKLRALDVALATSAAPAYFPAVEIDGALYGDGGLFAVAPDQVALHEAEHFIGINPARVRMVSIGTATAGYKPEFEIGQDDGAVGWLGNGRLILTLVSVQQQHVESLMTQRLGERYQRIDAPWPAGQGLGLDVATARAGAVLSALGRDAIAALDDDALTRLLGQRATR